MTKDKARKQTVRTRMAKTGERYTAARQNLLREHQSATPNHAGERESAQRTLPPRQAEPGMSDEAVQRATGKTWDAWFSLLDDWGATARSHAEIARHVAATHGISGWWAQTVTVGYERMRGMRAFHQRPDGFSVSVSKTFPVPADRLYAAFVEEPARNQWLDTGCLTLRTARTHRSARFDVGADGSRLAVTFVAKGERKSVARLQLEQLANAPDVERWRAFWKTRLEQLAAALGQG